jgi:hypothetical protein
MTNTSRDQKQYLAYIAANPGCSTADVVRACRRNPEAGHRWIYDSIDRLLRRGLVTRGPCRPESARGGAAGLFVPSSR